MLPEDIDDVFRQQLDGHPTPPPADLWARLQQTQQLEAPAPLDALFQARLSSHATPPRRELWERLEDEHLRPRPRRQRPVVAWWQLSAAALLLLALLGGGLWRGGFQGRAGGDTAGQLKGKKEELKINNTGLVIDNQASATTETPLVAAAPEKKQENFSAQATAPSASTSSTPIASTTRPRRTATTTPASADFQDQGQRPDAAAARSRLTSNGGRNTPASQHPHQPAVVPTTPAAHSAETPVLATATVATAPAAAPEIIEVEVRRGLEATRPAVPAVVAAAEPAPARRPRLRLGGLLRQADHLVHGERLSLAEATGLPETVVVQAQFAGRSVSKTIQL